MGWTANSISVVIIVIIVLVTGVAAQRASVHILVDVLFPSHVDVRVVRQYLQYSIFVCLVININIRVFNACKKKHFFWGPVLLVVPFLIIHLCSWLVITSRI
jgi:hypothetical protein